MRCLETRETAEGYRRRRYETATGQRHTTIEVPIEVWRRVNSVGRQRNRAEQVSRVLERERKQHQARLLRAAGRAPVEIAAALQVSRRTAERWTRG